jgi:hypothetical protein
MMVHCTALMMVHCTALMMVHCTALMHATWLVQVMLHLQLCVPVAG